MNAVSPLRFFATARLHSPYMLASVAIVGSTGLAIVLVEPSRAAAALVPLAVMQMFAASSGFAVPARRGHLDLLLTGGAHRVPIALTQLGLSILPGLLAWLMLGLGEIAAGGAWATQAFASGTVVTFAVISVAAWAITVPLPRLSGGLGWLLTIVILTVARADAGELTLEVREGTASPLARSTVIALCPLVLLGLRLPRDRLLDVVPALALAGLLGGAAVAWIARMNVPLESGH